MKLETAQSINCDPVTADDIRAAVSNDSQRGEFIILSSASQNYIQAAGDSEPFSLEYREGSASEHYQCVRDISRNELQDVLLKYLSGNLTWKSDFEWKKLENKPWWKVW